MRPLIVGQAPARRIAVPLHPSTCSGRRMAALLGAADANDVADVVTVVPAWHGKSGKGDAFLPSEEDAMRAASAVAGRWRVVLLGRRVAGLFGRGRAPYLSTFEEMGAGIMVFPHPSGVNRWWNDPANVSAAGAALRLWLFDS